VARRAPPPEAPGDDDEGPSKSQRKRDAKELQRLGVELVALPDDELGALPLGESLLDAILLARRITSHGALLRQHQFIGKLMRKHDVEAIRAALAARELEKVELARSFHRLELWRDRLIEEGESALAALVALHPALDAGALRALASSARGERAASLPPRAARELFRVLRAALPAGPGGG
jgi:ribosome-associated protein